MNPGAVTLISVEKADSLGTEGRSMSTHQRPSHTPWVADRFARFVSLRAIAIAAVVLLVGAAGWVVLGIGKAGTSADAVPVASSWSAPSRPPRSRVRR